METQTRLTDGDAAQDQLGHHLAQMRHEEGELLGGGLRRLGVVVETHDHRLVILRGCCPDRSGPNSILYSYRLSASFEQFAFCKFANL